MNSFAKRIARAAVTGIVLSSVLMTTACVNGSQPADATQSPAPSQSADAAPAAAPTPTPTQAASGPMGVDVDAAVQNADPSVHETFPNETSETVKEGVTFALSTYQEIIGIQNFYHARTASDNTLLAPVADKFDKTFYDAMAARTTANNGVIRDDFIAFGKGGEITGGSLGVHAMDPDKSINFVSGQPVVYAGATADGDVLTVKANATVYAPTADDKLVSVSPEYWVSVKHVGPGKWLVAGMGFHTADNPVVSDSVADPKAPNGK